MKLRRVTIRFISDPAAQVAALLSGDVDAFPRVAAARSLEQFKGDKRFQVLIGGSRAKTILAINNKRKPLDDVRVRRAIAAAIDRKAVIEGAADGFGVPIGSYYVPGAPGYRRPHGDQRLRPGQGARAAAPGRRHAAAGADDEAAAHALCAPGRRGHRRHAGQGGHHRQDRERRMGAVAVRRLQDKAYDLTVIAHVEPLDFGNFARPGYYWGYESPQFNALWAKIQATAKADERNKLMGDAQRLVAEDAVAAYLYQPTWITVANARLKGLWKDMPLFANDIGALNWQ